jgi:hypothetical protein
VQTTIFLSVICVIGSTGKSDARLLAFLRVTQPNFRSELGHHPHPSSTPISTSTDQSTIKSSNLLQPARVQWSTPHAPNGGQYTPQGGVVVADLHHQPKHAQGFRRRRSIGRDDDESMPAAPSTRFSAQAGFHKSGGDMTRFQVQRPADHHHHPYDAAYRFVPSGPDPLHNK